MFLFELTELLDQLVILFVGNFGIVLEVIQVFVAANLLPKPVDCFFDGRLFWQLQTLNRTFEQPRATEKRRQREKMAKQLFASLFVFAFVALCPGGDPNPDKANSVADRHHVRKRDKRGRHPALSETLRALVTFRAYRSPDPT